MPNTAAREAARSVVRDLMVLLIDEPRLLKLATEIAVALEPAPELPSRRHTADFAAVVWDGQHYSFTSAQAAAVRLLWEAYEQGLYDVRHESLASAVGSDRTRMKNLFRGHPAWGTMIVSGVAKGTLRLDLAGCLRKLSSQVLVTS